MSACSLMFGSFGNGITVSNRNREEGGDYQRIAHIARDRSITWSQARLPPEARDQVEHFAATADPSVSTSQPEKKVFGTRPPVPAGK